MIDIPCVLRMAGWLAQGNVDILHILEAFFENDGFSNGLVSFGSARDVKASLQKVRSPNLTPTHAWRPERPRRSFNVRLLMVFETA